MALATLCLDCGQLTARSPCPHCKRARNQADPYQTPRWRNLTRQHTAGATCTACPSRTRLTLHHLHGRHPSGDITIGPFAILCGNCHSTYEAAKRAGRTTTLTQHIDSLAAMHPRHPSF